MRANEPYNAQILIELMNSVEAATYKRPTVWHPISEWINAMNNHPEDFRIEDSQLIWLGAIARTLSGEDDILLKKWREVNEQSRTN